MSVREDLKAYLDGELSPARMAEVRAAVEADPSLRAELQFMAALGDGIRELSAEPEVVGLEHAVKAVRRPRGWWALGDWSRRPLVGAAAASLCVVVAAAGLRAAFEGGAADSTADQRPAVASPIASDRAATPPDNGLRLESSKAVAREGTDRSARFADGAGEDVRRRILPGTEGFSTGRAKEPEARPVAPSEPSPSQPMGGAAGRDLEKASSGAVAAKTLQQQPAPQAGATQNMTSSDVDTTLRKRAETPRATANEPLPVEERPSPWTPVRNSVVFVVFTAPIWAPVGAVVWWLRRRKGAL